MRIHDAIAEFLLQLEANGRSEHTLLQQKRHLGLLVAWLAPGNDIAQLTPTTLARFMASPAARLTHGGRERKASTVNALRGSLRGFGAFLHDSGYLPSNPTRLIRRAKCGMPPPRHLTAEEQAQLLKTLRSEDGAQGRDYALIHLGLATGLRLSSMLGLHVEDLSLARSEAAVRCAKGDRPTVVVLSKEIAGHLGEFIGERTSGPLFKVTARHARRQVGYWCERAGIRTAASPHTLRHSFGMRVYKATGDLLVTQAALGHASIQSTTIYARADRERLRAVLGA